MYYSSYIGMFLTLLRIILDVYLRSVVLNDLRIKKEMIKYEHISSFANSAMNIEFVYIILTAI
jgi:hypothetical protein